jgi:hypothetical protein
MATPTFQHGKNGFLALGYDLTSVATSALSADYAGTSPWSASVTPTTGGLLAAGIPLDASAVSPVTTTRYGAFVNGVPMATDTKFATGTSTYVMTVNRTTPASSGAKVLPMVNLSPYINDISFPQQIETPETTTFSQLGVRTYIVGLKGYTISFNGMYDPTAATSTSTGGTDAIMSALISWQDAGNFISFIYGPSSPGAFTGQAASVVYYGQALLQKYDLKSGVNAIVSFDGELQVTGVVTRSIL